MQQPTLEDQIIHEKFERCRVRLPDGTICGTQVDSPIALVQHYKANHEFPEMHGPLICAIMELKGPLFTSTEGERAYLKLAPYHKEKFGIIHVVEYEFWVRAWVTEADPSVDREQDVPVMITIPSPDTENHEEHEFLHQFTGKILPFGKYSFKKEDPVEYFDIPKNFAQQFYERKENGRFELSILFVIGDFEEKDVPTDDQGRIVIIRIREDERYTDEDIVGPFNEFCM